MSLLASIVLALALLPASQAENGSICGKVTKYYETRRVLLELGLVVPGARIVASQGVHKWEQRSDKDGRYCIRDLPPGTYDIVCTAPESLGAIPPVTGRVLVEPGSRTEYNAALFFSPGIRGRVIDRAGKPVAGALATLLPVSLLEGKRNSFLAGERVTKEDGSYDLLGIPPGRYRLEVRIEPPTLLDRRPVYYPGLSDTSRAIEFTLLDDQHLQAPDLRLERSRRLSGRVTVSGGKPAKSALVFLTDADKFSKGGIAAYVKCDESGRFTVDVWPGVALQLKAASLLSGGDFSESPAWVVPTEGHFRDVRLVLAPPRPSRNLLRKGNGRGRSAGSSSVGSDRVEKDSNATFANKDSYLRLEVQLPADLRARQLVLFARGRSKAVERINGIPFVAATFLPVSPGEKRPQLRRGTVGRFCHWWQPVSAIIPIPTSTEKVVVALGLRPEEGTPHPFGTVEIDDVGLYPFQTFTEAQIFLECLHYVSREAGRLGPREAGPTIHFSPLPGVLELGRPDWWQ